MEIHCPGVKAEKAVSAHLGADDVTALFDDGVLLSRRGSQPDLCCGKVPVSVECQASVPWMSPACRSVPRLRSVRGLGADAGRTVRLGPPRGSRKQRLPVAGVDEGIGEVDRGCLLRVRSSSGVFDEELLEGHRCGHENGQTLAFALAHFGLCCQRLAMVPGYPAVIAASSAPMSMPSSRALVLTTARSCAEQHGLDTSPLLEYPAR